MTNPPRSIVLPAIVTALLAASPATATSISGTDAGADEYRTAERIAQGFDGDRDIAATLAHYCRAAAQGHPGARYRIGWMLLNGRGVSANAGEAATWFQDAAMTGHKPSIGALRLIPGAVPAKKTVCPPVRREPSPALAALWARAPAGIRDLVGEIAPAHGLDPDLVLAVIAVESAFDPRAVSHASAQGLMQLMPGTAVRFNVADVFDPRQNIGGGARYLAELIVRYDADLDKVLAAYNAGENAVERYGGIPPYAETRNYVARIRALYD